MLTTVALAGFSASNLNFHGATIAPRTKPRGGLSHPVAAYQFGLSCAGLYSHAAEVVARGEQAVHGSGLLSG